MRPPALADEKVERPARPWVLELDIDLARRGFQLDLDPDRGDGVEDEEPRKPREGDRHGSGLQRLLSKT